MFHNINVNFHIFKAHLKARHSVFIGEMRMGILGKEEEIIREVEREEEEMACV